MKKYFKLPVFAFLFLIYIIGAVVLRFYAVTDVNRRRAGAWWTTKMCRVGLAFLNIHTDVTGAEYTEPAGKLIISNHMSYLDILIYASVRPTVFISSVEIQKTPFLGFVASIGGTFFVERRNPKLVRLEITKISDLIKEGFNVCLFPEGTSTDGSEILPFRSSLLAAASHAGVEVVPACIRYDSVNGRIFSKENCDTVCWYGDMSFAPHIWKLLDVKDVRSSAIFFQPMDTRQSDRKLITEKARQLITAEYFGAA